MSTHQKLPYLEYFKKEPTLWVVILADNGSPHVIEKNNFNLNKFHNKPTIQKTWMKAQEITSDPHILTVATKKQQGDLRKMGKKNIPGKIIFAPESQGTAAAIFLALAHILAKDPCARVVILPIDDYYQKHDHKLTKHINQATDQLLEHPEKAVCLADSSSELTNKHGQVIETPINKGTNMNKQEFLPIVKVHDKPKRNAAKNRVYKGALKTTGIIISSANLLWQCCMELLPILFEKMEYVYQVMLHFKGDKIGDDYVKMAISHAFYHLPKYDFTKDLINSCPEKFQALPITPLNVIQRPETQETLLVY